MGEANFYYFTCLKFLLLLWSELFLNMAAPAKRRNVEENPNEPPSSDDDEEEFDSDEEFEDGDDDGEDEDDAMGVEMNVNFDAQTASDADFHGIKRLLQQLFLKANVNLSAIADLILGQNHVGSVIKQAPYDGEEEDDDDMERDAVDEVFGISTVINLTQRLTNEAKMSEGDKAIKQMVDLLVEKSDKNGGPVQTKTLQAFLSNKEKHTGWLLNERFVNIPAQISLPLYDSLRDEMHSACAKGQKFKFDYFLLMSKALKVKGAKKKDQEELVFTNGEEELFLEESAFSFAFSVAYQQADADTILDGGNYDETFYEPWRVVMIIPAEKMEVVAKKMTDILGASIEGKVSSLR